MKTENMTASGQRLTHTKNQVSNISPVVDSDTSVLCFERHKVRIVNQDNEPWFVSKDACEALEIADHKVALRRLDTDEKGEYSIPTPGGIQKMRVISESGFYKLITRSRKSCIPGTFSYRFSNWVFRDVIPSIRKFGAYGVPWAVLHDFTLRSDDSMARGSLAGKGLVIRKLEKKRLEQEEQRLLNRYQPPLNLGVSDAE